MLLELLASQKQLPLHAMVLGFALEMSSDVEADAVLFWNTVSVSVDN